MLLKIILLIVTAVIVESTTLISRDDGTSFIEKILGTGDFDLNNYEISILEDFFSPDELFDFEYSTKEDAILDAKQIIKKYGYPLEVHHTTTEDGYILELHRIPYGKDQNATSAPRRVAFVQHGLLSSSSDWIIMGPGKGLGYILADAGYDVWMGNFRGNRYSRKHLNLDPNKSPFWQFSWHEMGVYDLPAMINKALAVSGQKKLFYMGHSQGTTSFFVMGAEKPEYNNKISTMFAMAPIAYMSKMTSPFVQILSKFLNQIMWVVDKIGLNEFLPNNNIINIAGKKLCNEQGVASAICSNMLFLLAGFNSKQLNATMLPVILSHIPAGSSTKQFLHYAQEVRSGHFRQYDFGKIKNLLKYKRATPPDYVLEKVTAPVVLHYSKNDWLSHPTDVEKLALRLPNVIGKHLNPDQQFNHLDYLWAIDADKYLYAKILEQMKRTSDVQ